MKKFGLIGYPLSHSFSKKYFSNKFIEEGITNCKYDNYEIEEIKLIEEIISNEYDIKGFNVTIPHKEDIIPYLDALHPAAERIGAVNVIAIDEDKKLTGYNSDYFGFKASLESLLNGDLKLSALVLGTGGASKAVSAALEDLGIYYQFVSRTASNKTLCYEDLTIDTIKEHKLLINTTPLGMSPKVNAMPPLPYSGISNNHYLYDLVYNPETTLFLEKGIERGAKTKNGLEMLHLQAEKAWEIWNKE